MSKTEDRCPKCGGELERDEADVGVGVIYGPAGCPSCHWVEGATCGARLIHGAAGERCGEEVVPGPNGFWRCPIHGDTASILGNGHPPLATGEISATMISLKRTCFDCRHVGTHKRPKIMEETGFDDQLMFADADQDETVYTCKAFGTLAVLGERTGPTRVVNEEELEKGTADGIHLAATFETRTIGVKALCEHAGKEIGLVPITCAAWAAQKPAASGRLAELDAMIAAREARTAKKEGV